MTAVLKFYCNSIFSFDLEVTTNMRAMLIIGDSAWNKIASLSHAFVKRIAAVFYKCILAAAFSWLKFWLKWNGKLRSLALPTCVHRWVSLGTYLWSLFLSRASQRKKDLKHVSHCVEAIPLCLEYICFCNQQYWYLLRHHWSKRYFQLINNSWLRAKYTWLKDEYNRANEMIEVDYSFL